MNIEYCLLSEPQIGDVVELIRRSFPKDRLDLTIYGQCGVGEFIRLELPKPGLRSTRSYWVAKQHETSKILGFAEFGEVESDLWHLSYVAVDEDTRRQGIAQGLLQSFLQAFPECTRMTLDVFADNVAVSMYEKLGFQPEGKAAWFTRSIPRASRGRELNVSNWAQAQACSRLYGFSTLELELNSVMRSVGLLGNRTVRTNSRDIFRDDEFLSNLHAALPELQRVFFISELTNQDNYQVGPVLLESTRMAVNTSVMRERLGV